MTRAEATQQAKWQLQKYVNSITTKSKGNMYICPFCHSGQKKNGTAAFSLKEDHWHCFSCNKGGDIFDLIGEQYKLTEYSDQQRKAFELLNINVDGTEKSNARSSSQKQQPEAQKDQKQQTIEYTEFYKQANQDLPKTTYHRGISLEVLNRFQVGYVENWKNPKAPKEQPTPRLIIPTSKSSYLARYAKEDAQEAQRVRKVGNSNIFNLQALYNARTTPIFVVEGEIDALSVIEAKAVAIGLGGTGNVNKLLEILEKQKKVPTLILALDNDKAGQEATEKLKNGLISLCLEFYEYNIAGTEKDANEALLHDREGFFARVKEAQAIEGEVARAKQEAYKLTSAGGQIKNFIKGITDSVNTPCISTGYRNLDNALDGGLYEGLYVIGALSGAGKTSFILQLVDQIAQGGNNVLYFSLEMASYELMAKSISRHTLAVVEKENLEGIYAKTARGITAGTRYAAYNQEQKDVINKAIEEYKQYASNIWFIEGVGNIGVNQIREQIKEHVKLAFNTPIVVVDYLQILAPADIRATDKQNMDKAIIELKRISRDYKTPVIVISSFNRASYQNKVSMEAFKESGAIEYSSDVLIGLQKYKEGVQGADIKEMQLYILKNRYGKTNMEDEDKPLKYVFYPKFNLFEEN